MANIHDDKLFLTIFSGGATDGSGGGGITPTGTKEIWVEYGEEVTEDVTAFAEVHVEASEPDGEIEIPVPYGNSVEVDVTDAATAIVTASAPTGNETIEITENGETTHDVKDAATVTVTVNVSSGGGGGDNKWANLFNNSAANGSVELVDSDFPDVFSLYNYAFYMNTKIGSIKNSKLISIPQYCFQSASGLKVCDAPNVTQVNSGSFSSCTALQMPSFMPSLTSVGGNAFASCIGLAGDLNLDSATEIGASAFNGCSKIETVHTAACKTIGQQAFQSCSAITRVDLLTPPTSMGSYAFRYCYKLGILHIGGTSVAAASTDAFTNAGSNVEGGLVVYVPDSLVEDYKVATTWAALIAAGTITIKPESELPD